MRIEYANLTDWSFELYKLRHRQSALAPQCFCFGMTYADRKVVTWWLFFFGNQRTVSTQQNTVNLLIPFVNFFYTANSFYIASVSQLSLTWCSLAWGLTFKLQTKRKIFKTVSYFLQYTEEHNVGPRLMIGLLENQRTESNQQHIQLPFTLRPVSFIKPNRSKIAPVSQLSLTWCPLAWGLNKSKKDFQDGIFLQLHQVT